VLYIGSKEVVMSAWEAHLLICQAEFISEEFLITGDKVLMEILSDMIGDLFAFAPEA